MGAVKAAAPIVLIAALLAFAALFLPDGNGLDGPQGPTATPTPTPTPTPTATARAGGSPLAPFDVAVAVLDAGAESDGAMSVWRGLNAQGLRVVLRPAARERTGVLVLVTRGARIRLARRIARQAQAPLRVVAPAALRRAGGPPDADVLVLVGRRPGT